MIFTHDTSFADERYNDANGHNASDRTSQRNSPNVRLTRQVPNDYRREVVSSEDSSGKFATRRSRWFSYDH